MSLCSAMDVDSFASAFKSLLSDLWSYVSLCSFSGKFSPALLFDNCLRNIFLTREFPCKSVSVIASLLTEFSVWDLLSTFSTGDVFSGVTSLESSSGFTSLESSSGVAL